MPRVPGALAPSSEDDEVDNINKAYQRGSWVALPLQSMDSIPFSDVSHAPYARSSLSYLNSTSGTSFQNATCTQSDGFVGDNNNTVLIASPRGATGQPAHEVTLPRLKPDVTGGNQDSSVPSTLLKTNRPTNRGPQPKSRRPRRAAHLTAEEKATMIALIQQEHVGALQRAETQKAEGNGSLTDAETTAKPAQDVATSKVATNSPSVPVERILPRPARAPATRTAARKAAPTDGNGVTVQEPQRPFSSPLSTTRTAGTNEPKAATGSTPEPKATVPAKPQDDTSAPSLSAAVTTPVSGPGPSTAHSPVLLVTLPRRKIGGGPAKSGTFPAAPDTHSARAPQVIERVLTRPTPPSQLAPSSNRTSAKATPASMATVRTSQDTVPTPKALSNTNAKPVPISEPTQPRKQPSPRQAFPSGQQTATTSKPSPRRQRPQGRRSSANSARSDDAPSQSASQSHDWSPENRPVTSAPDEDKEPAAEVHDNSTVRRAQQANEDRLTAFVESVSDPEVLHVIHDYLVEQKAGEPRFQFATATCEALLSKKEKLLDAQDRNSARRQVGAKVDSPVYLAPGHEAFGGAGDPNLAAALAVLAGCDDDEEDEDAALLDEFDDLNTDEIPYPHVTQFRFGEPKVSGVVSKVFAEGMLFKILDERDAYHFFNDTVRQVMMVRVRLTLTGKETLGPQVMNTKLEDGSGQHEITAVILPEETKFFISGVRRLPRVTAKAVQAPDDFVPPSVTKSMKDVASGIDEVRNAMGQWGKASVQKDYLKCCLKTNLPFTDLEFRPCAESLFRPTCDIVKIMPLTWRRPREYLYITEVSEARLFRGEISCHLVKQGELNDHTVVAGMAAIAQYPAHVMWMFRHPVSASLGKLERARSAFTVRVLQNGWWTTFYLDDYFPASMKAPLFARDPVDPRRLWVSLLEKAYAKSLGSYSALCLCDIMTVLQDFTGFPVRYLDDRWVQAQLKPTGHPSISLFKYIQRCTSRNHLIVLFTPSQQDETDETQTLHRKRSLRFIPINGIMPQFLPGRIYFLTEAAFYEALDLRMVRLKNPWTWETAGASELEKKWKYTAWFDQPDMSMSLLSASARVSNVMGGQRAAAKDDGRKATMWMEWGEVLKSFAGGGVCYAEWDSVQYRIKSQFDAGLPGLVVELQVLTKVTGFVTLTVEGVHTTLNQDGVVVDTIRNEYSFGTALVITRHNAQSNCEEIVGRSSDDPESFAGRPTFVAARDVSMKVMLDPEHSPYYIVPQLDPASVELMRTQGKSVLPFVVSLVLDTPCLPGKLEVRFKRLKPTCPVFSDESPFPLGAYSTVKARYQCTGHNGVVEGESSKLVDGLRDKT